MLPDLSRDGKVDARSVGLWLRHGWHVAIAYVAGFFVMLAVIGWHPDAPHRKRVDVTPAATAVLADIAK